MNLNERSLVSAFLSIFSATVVGLAISIVFTPLLVRLLGPEQYGDYALVRSVLALTIIFANSGVTRSVKKYLPEEGRADTWQSDVFGFYTNVSLVLVAVVCLPILVLSVFDFFGFVEERLVLYFQLMAGIVLFKQLYRLTRNSLQALGYERYSEPIKILNKGAFACFALALAYLGYGVTGVLIGYIGSLGLSAAVATVVLGRMIDLRAIVRRHVSLPHTRLLKFNGGTVIHHFMMESLYTFDIILLHVLTSEAQTGYYKAALVVAQLLWMVPRALQALLLHSTSKDWSAERYDRIQRISSLATRFVVVSACLMAAGLLVLADDFVPLYFGSEFVTAVTPIVLLLPGVIGFAMARPISAIIQGSGKLRVLIYATSAAATINVCLNVLLIPLYGIQGAAVATSIGYGSLAVFSVVAARHLEFDPVSDLRVLGIGAATLMATGTMYVIDHLVVNRYLSLAVIPVVGTTVYMIVILRTGVITKRETTRLTERLPDGLGSHTERLLSALT